VIASAFGIDGAEQVVFTQNATYALNLAIKGLITSPCHVLISDIEHNSVLRPIIKLNKTLGISFSIFSTSGDLEKNLELLIKDDTKAIISTLASNVTGQQVSAKTISDFANRHGLISIVDASQLAGHRKIDLTETPFTALCAPGHKGLFGIQGAGFSIFAKNTITETLIEGGSGAASLSAYMPEDLPERLEAGTLPTPSIVALRRGIEFTESEGVENIGLRLDKSIACFKERIFSIKNAEIFGGDCGILSFRIKDVSCDDLAQRLADSGICIRSGLHCAPLVHKKLGTLDTGLIRISLSALSGKRDADIFYSALKGILY
jgi:selenocysteine lyase/cysteine desulfurase